MTTDTLHKPLRIGLTLVSLAVFVFGFFTIISPFFHPIAWSVVICTVTWPLYRKIQKYIRRKTVSAFLMTLVMGLFFFAFIIPIGTAAINELIGFLQFLKNENGSISIQSIEKIKSLPYIGEWTYASLQQFDVAFISENIKKYNQELMGVVTSTARSIAGALFTFIFTLFTMFFIYRDGASLARQSEVALTKIAGPKFAHLMEILRGTIRGAVYGLLMTAVAQGVLAGASYVVAGMPFAYVLGLVTMIASLVPFGTPFVYIPVAGYLVYSGSVWGGIGVALFGIFVVSLCDNILRPIFISQATELPVLLILMGVLGGILTFGLLGLFIGPAIVSVALVLWHEFIEES